MIKNLFFFIGLFVLIGCQASSVHRSRSIGSDQRPSETVRDVQTAVKSVADSVTFQQVNIKYCPTCGRRYSPEQERCPLDGALLMELKDE